MHKRRLGPLPSPLVPPLPASLFPLPHESGARLPEFRKEFLVDRAHQVPSAQRSARSARARANHALDELDMVEPPLSEELLVLEQCFREKVQHRWTRAEVEVLDLRMVRRQQIEKQLLQRRAIERVLDERRNVSMLLEHLHEMRVAQT